MGDYSWVSVFVSPAHADKVTKAFQKSGFDPDTWVPPENRRPDGTYRHNITYSTESNGGFDGLEAVFDRLRDKGISFTAVDGGGPEWNEEEYRWNADIEKGGIRPVRDGAPIITTWLWNEMTAEESDPGKLVAMIHGQMGEDVTLWR